MTRSRLGGSAFFTGKISGDDNQSANKESFSRHNAHVRTRQRRTGLGKKKEEKYPGRKGRTENGAFMKVPSSLGTDVVTAVTTHFHCWAPVIWGAGSDGYSEISVHVYPLTSILSMIRYCVRVLTTVSGSRFCTRAGRMYLRDNVRDTARSHGPAID